MKKLLPILTLFSIYLLLSLKIQAQNRYGTLQGMVIDNISKQPVTQALVTLRSNSLKQPRQLQTNSDGYFTFDSLNPQAPFTIEIYKINYQPYSSSYAFQKGQNSLNVGSITLQKVHVPPTAAVTDTATYVKNTLASNLMLPTNGATELLYLLNPELRNKDAVPANYPIRLPSFPRADRQKERQFNDQFKLDKHKDPSLFTNSNHPSDFTPLPFIISGSSDSPLPSSGIIPASFTSSSHSYITYKDKHLEKFVFVMFKTDGNGKPITSGYEVENRFLVYYTGLYKEGDTSTYHRARDATYGYATMAKATYKIIVVDQVTNRQVRISDPIIETSIFFDRHDLFTLLDVHLSWIKIPIHVYD